MLPLIKQVADRFKEPSSYAGLAGLLVVVHVSIPPGALNSLELALSGICGLVSFFLAEKSAPKE